MKYKVEYPTKENLKGMNKVSEGLFGSGGSTMVAPTMENAEKMISLEKNTLVCYKENSVPIAWSLVLPTSRENADKFLNDEITELELFNKSVENPKFESLYLFVVITMPEYRQKGLGSSLMKYQIEYFKKEYSINDFYAWVLSLEGKRLAESLKRNVEPSIRFISEV